MNPLHTLRRAVCNMIISAAPVAFLDALRRNHYELMAREFNKPYLYSWKEVRIPECPDGFEDLTPLFDLSPVSRGIIRQDFDEAAALFKAVRQLPHRRGVEIGRYSGGSTVLLAVALGHEGKLTSIDIMPQDDRLLEEVLAKSKVRSRVELIIGDANQVEVNEPLDFVFIDGDHSYEGAKRDHNRWGKRVKKDGLIIHHDMANSRRYSTQWTELARLRAEILEKQPKFLNLVNEVGSMAIFRKTSDSWTEI